ncbi:kinase-like domain-containing protein [Mycena olivaceomarginata]|nr:kinase-like domain-containing protein [Mycena olivaceomarginata]
MGALQAGIKSIVNGLNRRIQALQFTLLVVVLFITKVFHVDIITSALNALDLLFGLTVQLIASGNRPLLLAYAPANLAATDLTPTSFKPIDSSYLDLPGPNALLDVLTFRPRSRPINSLGVKHSVHIDDIRIIKELGRGGFGRVVRVETKDKTRQFALKKIKKIAIDWRSFRDEVGIHTLMEDHPAFPSVHGVFHDCLHFFLIMDIGGESFGDFRMTSKAGALFFGAKLMAALHVLHERGVVHLDIKPANLLLGENNTLRVIDYGVSQRFDLAGPTAAEFPRWCKLRDEGGACFPMLWPGPENPHIVYGRGGTPTFMSPPDRHHLPSSYGSDIWALGVTMYEWITLGTCVEFAVDGTWAVNKKHQLSAVEVDFFQRAFSWTVPHRFEKLGRDSAPPHVEVCIVASKHISWILFFQEAAVEAPLYPWSWFLHRLRRRRLEDRLYPWP